MPNVPPVEFWVYMYLLLCPHGGVMLSLFIRCALTVCRMPGLCLRAQL